MKNEKDKSPSSVSFLLLLLIMVTAGVIILNDKEEIEQLKQNQAAMHETIEIRDSVISEMLNTFGKIEQNLSFVRNKRNEIILLVQESDKSWQELLISDIQLMNNILEMSSLKTAENKNKQTQQNFEILWLKRENERLGKLILAHENSIKHIDKEPEQTDFQITQTDIQFALYKTEIARITDTTEIKPQSMAIKAFNIFE